MAASKQASKQASIHTHVHNAVMLVWGSLRLAPMRELLSATRNTGNSTCTLRRVFESEISLTFVLTSL